MSEELTLIIFDCDGTMVDSQHLIVRAMADAFAACGLEPPHPEDTRRIIGLSILEAVSRLHETREPDLLEKIGHRFRAAYQQFAHETAPLFDGTVEAVRKLAGRDHVLLGIATGKSQRGVRLLLDHYKMRECFATIQTADDAPSKPHPGMIDQAMHAVGALPHRTVMIGDTSFDMEMAGHAGVHAVGVSWGYHAASELSSSGAGHIVQHFNELEAVIDRLW